MDIKSYSSEDLKFILDNFEMRKIDQEEVTAQSGLHYTDALIRSLEGSHQAWYGVVDGKPIGVGGFVLADGFGVPWFVRSDEAFNDRLFELNGLIMGAVDIALSKTNYLTNYVAEDNKDTIKWLKFLGFTVTDDRFILKDPDMVFLHFYMMKKEHKCVTQP